MITSSLPISFFPQQHMPLWFYIPALICAVVEGWMLAKLGE